MVKKIVLQKPYLFERTDDNIWTDTYIQLQMLKEHLNPESDGASRKETFHCMGTILYGRRYK